MTKPFDNVEQNNKCRWFKDEPDFHCGLDKKCNLQERRRWSYDFDEICDIRDEKVCYLANKEKGV